MDSDDKQSINVKKRKCIERLMDCTIVVSIESYLKKYLGWLFVFK